MTGAARLRFGCVPVVGAAFALLASGCGGGQVVHADGCPYWSPDGRSIAFTRAEGHRSGQPQLDAYVVGRDGRTPRRLTRTSADEDVLGWPSSSEIVVSRGDGLYELGRSGSGVVRRIGRVPRGAIVWLAPTGRHLAMLVPTSSALRWRVYVLDLRTGWRSVLPIAHGAPISWSADGSRLVYAPRDLVMQIVRRDGRVVGRIDDTVIAAPSPDGSEVAYIHGFYAVYLWDVRRRRGRRLVASEQIKPSWSADGKTVFYERDGIRAVSRDGRHDHFVSALRDLDDEECLQVSPDQRRIAFVRVAFESTALLPRHDDDLVVMNADGSRRHLVPHK